MRNLLLAFLLSFVCFSLSFSFADSLDIYDTPSSFEEDADVVSPSPKEGWRGFPKEEPSEPLWQEILLWIPNRVLDLIDVFKFDIGVGPSFGGVVRVTEYGQAGYRQMLPLSARVGNFGRTWPLKIESSNEFGIGPAFVQSASRDVCTGEVGLGVDLVLIGGYGGICFDELADFFSGLILIDLEKDDL